jgi:hypothetical protein
VQHWPTAKNLFFRGKPVKRLTVVLCLLLIGGAAGLPKQDSRLKKYVSPNGRFEFSYPGWLVLHTDPESYSENDCTNYLFCVEYPENLFEGTDFAGGWFQLRIALDSEIKNGSGAITSKGQCLAFNDYARYEGRVSNTMLHGVHFATLSRAGAALGTLSDIQLYRTFHSGTCYELNITTAIANGGYSEEDYQSGGIKHFSPADTKKVQAVLQGILNSFHFLK